jgi:hypothetical protein
VHTTLRVHRAECHSSTICAGTATSAPRLGDAYGVLRDFGRQRLLAVVCVEPCLVLQRTLRALPPCDVLRRVQHEVPWLPYLSGTHSAQRRTREPARHGTGGRSAGPTCPSTDLMYARRYRMAWYQRKRRLTARRDSRCCHTVARCACADARRRRMPCGETTRTIRPGSNAPAALARRTAPSCTREYPFVSVRLPSCPDCAKKSGRRCGQGKPGWIERTCRSAVNSNRHTDTNCAAPIARPTQMKTSAPRLVSSKSYLCVPPNTCRSTLCSAIRRHGSRIAVLQYRSPTGRFMVQNQASTGQANEVI